MAGPAGVSELSLRAGTALTVAAIVGSVTLLRGPSPLVVAGGLVVGGLLGLLVGTLVAALMRLGSIGGARGGAPPRHPPPPGAGRRRARPPTPQRRRGGGGAGPGRAWRP